MTRKDKILAIAIVAVFALVGVHAFLSMDFVKGGRTVISRVELKNLDPANDGINIEVTQPWINTHHELAFNVGKPVNDRSFDRFDVTRCLLQCAQALGDRDFSRIYLCNDGNRLYYINAEDFKQLGEQYNGEALNTLSLYVKLPQVAFTLNDSAAFQPNDGVLHSIADAQDWNTMMSNLLR